MKKKFYSIMLAVLVVGSLSAQTLPDGMVSLLPNGVKANISGAQRKSSKDLIIAGSKTSGYKAYFSASDEDHGEELWVTDGTPAGTKMVKDINPGSASSDVNYITRFNDKVVFAADDGNNGLELWISDGTADGTFMIKDVNEFGDSNPSGFVQLNETQFIFGAKTYDSENYDPDFGEQKWLWVSDGTEEGTQLIKECKVDYPGRENASYTDAFMRVGRKVFFKAEDKDSTFGSELWVTDGTEEGTKMIMDINTQHLNDASGAWTGRTADAAIDNMFNYYNRKLYFKCWTPEYGNEPWATDGTPEGTYLIYDTWPGFSAEGSPYGQSCGALGKNAYHGYLYYRAYSVDLGYELGRTNLERGNHEIFDINLQNYDTNLDIRSSYPDPGIVFDGVYCFQAYTGFDTTKESNHGGEVHYFDDSDNSMGEITNEVFTANNSDWAKDLTTCGGSLYWWNDDGPEGYKNKLWRADSHLSEATRVVDLVPGGQDLVNSLRNLNGTLLFCQQISTGNQRLFAYSYRKPGYDAEKEAYCDEMDPVFDPIEIDWASGIDEIETAPIKLSVYPNPATESFSFNVDGDVKSVKIYDLAGRIVKEDIEPSTNVNVTSLAAGMYKVMVTTTSGRYFSSLIVK